MTEFLQTTAVGLAIGVIYGLAAVGIVLIYKTCKTFNFSQGGLLMLGAFWFWHLTSVLELPIWLSVLLIMVFALLLGFGLERFPLRPMYGQPEDAIITMTIGLYVFFNAVVMTIWGGSQVRSYPPFFPAESLTVGPFSFSHPQIWGIGIALLLLILVSAYFQYTRGGLSMRALAEDNQVAQSMGIRINWITAITWALAAGTAMAAGILLGVIGGVVPYMCETGLKALAVAMLGGLESLGGCIIAGIIIGVCEMLATSYIGYGSQEVVAFIILMAVLIFRPYGLFGLAKIERV